MEQLHNKLVPVNSSCKQFFPLNLQDFPRAENILTITNDKTPCMNNA